MNKVKKVRIIGVLVVAILMLFSTMVKAETSIPTFKLVGVDAQRGGTAEVKLVVANTETITETIVISTMFAKYDKRLEVAEVKAADSYIVKENIDKENGKISIAFSGKSEMGENTFERDVCTIKFKIPKDFPDNTETKLEIKSVKDVFSASSYINQYYDEAGVIKVSGDYTNWKAIIIIGGACTIFLFAIIYLIAIAVHRKKK